MREDKTISTITLNEQEKKVGAKKNLQSEINLKILPLANSNNIITVNENIEVTVVESTVEGGQAEMEQKNEQVKESEEGGGAEENAEDKLAEYNKLREEKIAELVSQYKIVKIDKNKLHIDDFNRLSDTLNNTLNIVTRAVMGPVSDIIDKIVAILEDEWYSPCQLLADNQYVIWEFIDKKTARLLLQACAKRV